MRTTRTHHHSGEWDAYLYNGKFLGSLGVWWNGAPSSHIHGRPHHEFNKRTTP